jgi:hypothetical protein
MLRWTKALCLLSLAAGCTCGGPTTAHDLFTDEVGAICSFYARCGEIGKSEEQSCNSGGSDYYNTYSKAVGAYDIDAAIMAGRLAIDPNAANTCLGAIKAIPCNSSGALLALGTTCQHIYVGKVALGSSCQNSYECSNGFCQLNLSGNTCMGTCAAFAAEGASCKSLGCDTTKDFCDTTQVCRPKGNVGAACTSTLYNTDCMQGLACNGTTCSMPGGAGQPCAGGTCANGYHCVQGTGSSVCAANVQAGSACTDPAACPDGERCAGLSGTTSGTCTQVVDVGSACDPMASTCPADAPCDATTHTCTTPPSSSIGASCTSSCASTMLFAVPLYCDQTSHQCAKQLLPGDSCTPATMGQDPCVTTCDATSHVCTPATATCH